MKTSKKYKCNICNKVSKQKSHHDSHLISESHKDKCKIFILELEKKSGDELLETYKSDNRNIIIKRMCGIEIPYKLIKQRKSEIIHAKLTEEDKLQNKGESEFKNIFRSKLKLWHDLLSGAGTTGDPALDDIINIMMICYLQDKIKSYDFKNIKHYYNDNIYKEYFKYLDINELLKDTQALRPIDNSISSIEQLGELLVLHPFTKNIIKNRDFINCKKPLIIQKLIKDIYTFTEKYNIFKFQDLIGNSYEFWMNTYKGNQGQELGNYFTERKLMRMCFELVDKDDLVRLNINDNSTMGDEFCGTYGFPLYLKSFLKSRFDIKIKDKNMYGVEFEERASRFAILNAMFSMKDFSNIKRGDSFQTNVSPHLDFSVHNVPFGDRMKYKFIEEDYNNKKTDDMPNFNDIIAVKKNTDAVLSSQVVLYKTKKMGLCIIKDGKETAGKQMTDYRKYFCENCIIKRILKIPSGCFASTGTKTACIYFIKEEGKMTENIQFLQLDDNCSKITEICNISIDDLKHNNYSWNPDVYLIDEETERLTNNTTCEIKNLSDLTKIDIGSTPSKKESIYWNNGIYPHVSVKELNNSLIPIINSNKKITEIAVSKCKPKLVKKGTILMSFKLSIGKLGIAGCNLFTNEAIVHINTNNEILNKWIYFYFYTFKPKASEGCIGNGNLNKSSLSNLKVAIPLNYDKVVYILDDLSNQKELLKKRIKGISRQKKYYLENKLKSNKLKTKKIVNICQYNRGKRKTKKEHIDNGEYYVIGGGYRDKKFKINEYNREGYCCKIARYGASVNNFILILNEKFWLHDNGFSIKSNNTSLLLDEYLGYYLVNNVKTLYHYKRIFQGSPPAMDLEVFNNINILIPNLEIQNEIICYLDNLKKNENIYYQEIDDIDNLMKSIVINSLKTEKKTDKKIIKLIKKKKKKINKLKNTSI